MVIGNKGALKKKKKQGNSVWGQHSSHEKVSKTYEISRILFKKMSMVYWPMWCFPTPTTESLILQTITGYSAIQIIFDIKYWELVKVSVSQDCP